jgi:hypothetical protein
MHERLTPPEVKIPSTNEIVAPAIYKALKHRERIVAERFPKVNKLRKAAKVDPGYVFAGNYNSLTPPTEAFFTNLRERFHGLYVIIDHDHVFQENDEATPIVNDNDGYHFSVYVNTSSYTHKRFKD